MNGRQSRLWRLCTQLWAEHETRKASKLRITVALSHGSPTNSYQPRHLTRSTPGRDPGAAMDARPCDGAPADRLADHHPTAHLHCDHDTMCAADREEGARTTAYNKRR